MILPIRTSIQPRRTPYANYAMIAANVVIFLLTYHPHINIFEGREEYLHDWANKFILDPEPGQLHYWQFVSYAFLHASFMHIFGNMFFLYLFGNNVNDKLGNIGYTVFYLVEATCCSAKHPSSEPAAPLQR
jgi:membrane associated rhomboid family serine protease